MRKVFVSYSHRLDQRAAEDFRNLFSSARDVFIDKSIREDVGHYTTPTIKDGLRKLIADSSVTVILIGGQTGGRWWVDWEIYNSLRKSAGNERNGLLGVQIPYKHHWTPERLKDNVPTMGHVVYWPKNYRTLNDAIEAAYNQRWNKPNLSRPLRQKNSSQR